MFRVYSYQLGVPYEVNHLFESERYRGHFMQWNESTGTVDFEGV